MIGVAGADVQQHTRSGVYVGRSTVEVDVHERRRRLGFVQVRVSNEGSLLLSMCCQARARGGQLGREDP